MTIKSEDCPRITDEFLERERSVLSERAYLQEYECRFLESHVAVFPADIIERLTDQNARRYLMPDDEELRERQKDAKAIKTPDDLNEFKEKHGEGALMPDSILQPPGPWADL